VNDDVLSIAAPAVREWEGLRLTAYRDSGGLLSIGYGHVLRRGEPHSISRSRAEELLRQDMAGALKLSLEIPGLKPHQHAALTSLIYNIGGGAFLKSTLRKRLIEVPRDDNKVFAEWRRWHLDNGKPVQGLRNRREKEISLYKGTS
jgi:lysozyme